MSRLAEPERIIHLNTTQTRPEMNMLARREFLERSLLNAGLIWFRTLTLAYLSKTLPDSTVGQFDWQFGNCPGLQFWTV